MNAADILKILKAPQGETLVDVRTPFEYNAGHIPGAIHIEFPLDAVPGSCLDQAQVAAYEAAGFDKDDTLILYCQSGVRAEAAADILKQAGFRNISVYKGSWADWTSDPTRPIER